MRAVNANPATRSIDTGLYARKGFPRGERQGAHRIDGSNTINARNDGDTKTQRKQTRSTDGKERRESGFTALPTSQQWRRVSAGSRPSLPGVWTAAW